MALPATEAFTGVAAALGGSWSQQVAGSGTTVNKDGAGLGTTSGTNASFDVNAFWNADVFSNDQYSQMVWKQGAVSAAYCEVTVRATDTTTATFDNYIAFASGSSTSGETGFAVYVNGTETILASYSQAWASGDVMRLEASGTNIQMFRAAAATPTSFTALGVAISNSALASGSAGCGGFWGSGGTAPKFDDWEGGNLSGGSPPVITAHPASVTVYEGQTANFSVTATGTGALSYQWKQNGSSIGGETASSYARTNVVYADNGNSYTVDVTDTNGTTTSNAALLTVLMAAKPFYLKA